MSRRFPRTPLPPVLALAAGFAVLAAIVRGVGPASVFAAARPIGAGFLVLVVYRLFLVVLMGASWRVLGNDGGRAGVLRFAWARLIRDSASECLPLSQVGGFVLGGRALAVAGVPGAFAVASTVVDVTLELVAQLAYTALGLVLLHALRPDLALVRSLAVGLAVLGAGAAIFLVLQATGGRWSTALLGRALGQTASRLASGTHAVLGHVAAIYRRPARIAAGVGLHGLDWLGNGLEAALALRLMDHPVALRDALVIDSLLYGLRSFAFVVPNALGVQEAGYVLLGGLFGLPAATSLALSLLRRARDIAIGVPALATWQLLEGRRALRRRRGVGRAQSY